MNGINDAARNCAFGPPAMLSEVSLDFVANLMRDSAVIIGSEFPLRNVPVLAATTGCAGFAAPKFRSRTTRSMPLMDMMLSVSI